MITLFSASEARARTKNKEEVMASKIKHEIQVFWLPQIVQEMEEGNYSFTYMVGGAGLHPYLAGIEKVLTEAGYKVTHDQGNMTIEWK